VDSAWLLPPRDRLVMEHLPLARAIAARVRESLPPHVEMDDLTSHGLLGLLDAATRFDPSKQIAFGVYARHRIRGAILDSLRELDSVSRETRRQHRRVESATRELSMELQRSPTDAEVADKLSMSDREWQQVPVQMRAANPVSTDTRDSEASLPAPEHPAPAETRPDTICAKEQLKGFLATAMAELPPRYRKVVMLYYSSEMTMREIGDALGVNESRISQIHKVALSKLNRSLQAAGIHSASALC
jgi:RNA polymerase sigma factor for flagellar operon FliA